MRLHKYLANAGFGSRRTIESWIKAGKIYINGQCARIGQEIKLHDKVEIDGKNIQIEKTENPIRAILYHKPEGEICSTVSEKGKKCVFDNLPPLALGKWVMIGRLDVNSSGLLLFTNDGEFAHRLMHPRFQMERQYAVRVMGEITSNTVMQLKKGVMIDGEISQFQDIAPRNSAGGANQWFTVTLKQGKYREVRRLWEAVGCTVSRLIRIKYGCVTLPKNLRKGKWQELPEKTINQLIS